ncbi:type 3 dihydrofolate reductase [Alteromonas pelagimontana]|uniref:Dihydrofolate reductase n=2 Tax=Alteromonas pelagimontana TaxID=1858656 RepID=A0A6M4MI41_9ALTE|nr:type 3 dihydrofolate reductase [Alteromonas pelagimontana]
MIAAMAHNRVIGADNGMPWRLPADLRHFKQKTVGKPIIMGRKTYDSIGKALPGRTNIVLSSKQGFLLPDACVVPTPDDAIDQAMTLTPHDEEIMVIGGGKIYEAFMPLANTLYLTFIDLAVEGDTYFPDYLAQGKWNETAREAFSPDDNNPYHYEFVTFERVS